MAHMVDVELEKFGLHAFVRIKDKDAESITFEIRFSESIMESVLNALANEAFGSGYSTSERYFTIRFKGLSHKQCCEKLDAFLKKFDEKLFESIQPFRKALVERFGEKAEPKE
jgi:hypothetical protein